MNIKLTKHWHYLVAFLVAFFSIQPVQSLGEVIGGAGGRFVASAIMGFLWVGILIMWAVFAFSKKDNPTEEKK